MSMAEPSTELPVASPLPSVDPFKPDLTAPLSSTRGLDEADRNPVFKSLVTGDSDVVGLVAYSVYKQNKHDWLLAFAKAKGREPEEAEITAYIIGESTPRRLSIYRHLAHATLDGKGPDVPVGTGSDARARVLVASTSRNGAARAQPHFWGRAFGYVVVAVIVAAVVLVAIRYGLIPSPR